MAEKFTNKKFLDEAGLKKVFELIKANYASLGDVNDLDSALDALEKLVGNWSDTNNETVIGAIETIKSQIGEWDEQAFTTIAEAAASLQSQIDGMNLTEVGGEGKIITTVSQTDGKVSATASELASTDKTVTVNGLDLAVNIDGDTIVKGSDGKLSVSASATAVSGKEAIEVGTATEGGKEVSLKIDSKDNVLSQTDAGLLASLELKYTKATEGQTGKIELIGKGGVVIGTAIDTSDFTTDGFLDKVEWKEAGSNILVFTWNTNSGKTATEIDLTKYIDTYAAGTGLALDSATKTFSVKVKEGDKYITVGTDGIESKGIDNAIETAVDAAKTEVKDELIGDAEELTDFGAVESEINDLKDTIEEIDDQIDAKIDGLNAEESSEEGTFVTVTVKQEKGVITEVSVEENDIASDTDLQAEISARKAVTGVDADAYTANGSTNYLKTVGSLKAADEALDTALKGVADDVAQLKTDAESYVTQDDLEDYIKYEDLEVLSTTEIESIFAEANA